jgi:hypothetical protein
MVPLQPGGPGLVVWRASYNGVYSGGGATKATGVCCQFSEGDSRLCPQVHRAARQGPERRETPGGRLWTRGWSDAAITLSQPQEPLAAPPVGAP